jgi:hypothetical protein
LPLKVDVNVKFNGGWLTEFYPKAHANAPGLRDKQGFQFGDLSGSTVGSLAWKDLQVGTDVAWPKTDENVWLAPRRTQATPV